jgi:hypothetical protein
MSNINVSSIYPEAGVTFPISYRFMQLLKEELAHLSEQHLSVFSSEYGQDYMLSLILSANSDAADLEIKGPSISKSYKAVDYVLRIPFAIVEEAETFYSTYVFFVCQGISTVLEKFMDARVVEEAVTKFKNCALEQQAEFLQA